MVSLVLILLIVFVLASSLMTLVGAVFYTTRVMRRIAGSYSPASGQFGKDLALAIVCDLAVVLVGLAVYLNVEVFLDVLHHGLGPG